MIVGIRRPAGSSPPSTRYFQVAGPASPVGVRLEWSRRNVGLGPLHRCPCRPRTPWRPGHAGSRSARTLHPPGAARGGGVGGHLADLERVQGRRAALHAGLTGGAWILAMYRAASAGCHELMVHGVLAICSRRPPEPVELPGAGIHSGMSVRPACAGAFQPGTPWSIGWRGVDVDGEAP